MNSPAPGGRSRYFKVAGRGGGRLPEDRVEGPRPRAEEGDDEGEDEVYDVELVPEDVLLPELRLREDARCDHLEDEQDRDDLYEETEDQGDRTEELEEREQDRSEEQ